MNNYKKMTIGLGILAIMLTTGCKTELANVEHGPEPQQEQETVKYQIKEIEDDVALLDYSTTEQTSLNKIMEEKGGGLVLISSVYCPYYVDILPKLSEIEKEMNEDMTRLINQREIEELPVLIEETNSTPNYHLVGENQDLDKYEVKDMPHLMYVDSGGELVRIYEFDDSVEDIIQSVNKIRSED